MSENKNYNQKKVLYNPTVGSIFLLIILVGLIYLIFKSDNLRSFLIQLVEKSNDFILKHL